MHRSFRSQTTFALVFITVIAALVASAANALQVGECTALANTGGAVNLRTAPGEWAGAVNAIGGNAGAVVLARVDNGWLQVKMDASGNAFHGFIPESQVTLNGNCDGLPVVPASNYDPTPVVNILATDVSPNDVRIPADYCTVTAAGRDAVIFAAPEPVSAGVGILSPGPWLTATAWDGGAWYQVTMFNGGQGWVEFGTVDLHGPCGTLPVVNIPRVPTSTPMPYNGTCQIYTNEQTNVPVFAQPFNDGMPVAWLTPNAYYVVFTQVEGWFEVYHEIGRLVWVAKWSGFVEGYCDAVPLPTPTLVDFALATPEFCTLSSPSGADVHLSADANSPVIAFIPGGMVYNVFARVGNWVEIFVQAIGLGWVNMSAVSLVGNCAALPAPTATLPAFDMALTPTFTTDTIGNGTPVYTTPSDLGLLATATALQTTAVQPSPTMTPIPTAEVGLCVVISRGEEVVTTHLGPGDEYTLYDQLQPGVAYLGVTLSDNQWVEVRAVTRESELLGWVSERETILSDECIVLPLVAAAEYHVEAWYPEP